MRLLRQLLSPFPPDAHRPLRGVWIYVSHAVEEHLRSWVFWLGMLGVPAISVVVVLGLAVAEILSVEELGLWAEDATVGEQLVAATPRRGLTVKRLEERPDQVGWDEAVLLVEGAGLDGLRPVLLTGQGVDGDDVQLAAERLIRRARRRAYLTEGERATLWPSRSGPEVSESQVKEVSDQAGGLEALVGMAAAGLLAFMGAIAGGGSAQELSKLRDEEYFHVLRLGTPVSVIFVGGLLERVVLGVLGWLPLVAMAGLAMVLVLLMGAAVDLVEALRIFVLYMSLCGLAGVVGWLVGAGVGGVVGSLSRNPQAPGVGGPQALYPFALMLGFPLGMYLLQYPADSPGWTLAVPVIGVVVAVKGVGGGMGLGWVGLSAVVQLLMAMGLFRAGAWAYGLEEELPGLLRRRLGRLL